MESEPPPQMELPPCDLIADTGGIALLPFPRHYTPKGSPFHVAPVCYLYISSRVNQYVRKRFVAMTEKLPALGIRIHINSVTQLAPTQAIFTDSGQFPKWVHFEPQLRGDAARPGGYKLSVMQDGIVLHGADEAGVQHACSTLHQLIEDGPDVPGMEIEDHPILRYRAVHLDCKGWPPRTTWLKKAIDLLAAVKINILILEYEAHIDYPSLPGLAAEGALSAREIQDLDTYARENGVTLVPLLSCVGNVGHVLSRPEYMTLREHPDSARTYCISNPETLNLLVTQLNDLLPIHSGKMVHIGGDGAFHLGASDATQARAEELGGIDAVYLDHIGSLCRFLCSNGVQPLVWDELLRGMTDDQLKWLPSDATIIFWLPEGLDPDIAQDVLAHLARYKVLKRQAWGSVLISPSEHFRAFDNLDAWAEISELDYISGMVATVRTREFAGSAMLPPPESFWSRLYYAADRAWTGKQTIVRELFPQRFMTRFFGLKNIEAQSRLWAGFVHYINDNPQLAHAYFRTEARHVPKNLETAMFLEAWTAIQGFMRIFLEVENDVRGNFLNIQNGSADTLLAGHLRWRTQELKARAPSLIVEFTQAAESIAGDWPVHEFIESSVAYTLRRIDEIEPLLANFPLPNEALREPLGI